MIFASRTPRDIYDTTATATTAHEDGTLRVRDLPGRGITLDTASGNIAFRKVQNNDPNPILVWLRAIWDDPKCGTHAEIVDYMLNDPLMIDPRMHENTPARIDHARRVLNRIARLTQTEN